MLILTLAVSDEAGADAFCSELTTAIDQSVLGEQVLVSRHDRCFIQLHSMQGRSNQANLKADVTAIVAPILAEYIVHRLEQPVLKQMIDKYYHDYPPQEAEEILSFCQVLLNGIPDDPLTDLDPVLLRIAEVTRKSQDYLSGNSYIHVEGFMRFRLSGYRSELKDTLDYAVDEFLSNKQYQEFIGLLKYFVYFQDAKLPEVHLVHHGGNKYVILDHRLNPITLTQSEEVVVETIDRELNYEDMVVSTLISASPQHVFIHTREPDTLSIKTIRQIFEGRTTLCSCCKLCSLMINARKSDVQLTT